MTREESHKALRESILSKKLDAYEHMLHLSRLTGEQLYHAGYPGMSNAETVLSVLNEVSEEIEFMIRKWERDNPDDDDWDFDD